jgi:hypothetical protein
MGSCGSRGVRSCTSIANITTAFDNLKARKPAPVMLVKKSGR